MNWPADIAQGYGALTLDMFVGNDEMRRFTRCHVKHQVSTGEKGRVLDIDTVVDTAGVKSREQSCGRAIEDFLT